MFTGIIEEMGEVLDLRPDGTNVHIRVRAAMTPELKIDQSVAHNGVCLTVVDIQGDTYEVTAIEETLKRTNLGDWKPGSNVNLERCMTAGGRFDGHIVQGHVDTTATCVSVEERDGSWNFHFEYDPGEGRITVEKGSITINGVSLTVVESTSRGFSVSIIPFTYEHTNFKDIQKGSRVNLEFDIVGKYVARLMGK
ncbi:riboflavin synthase [Cryomorphaceae bacterium]|nr:riboflavin synthase [Cryomorphaceae bacterium]